MKPGVATEITELNQRVFSVLSVAALGFLYGN
jgi:hypothetical protein